jgi:hypothetical protein
MAIYTNITSKTPRVMRPIIRFLLSILLLPHKEYTNNNSKPGQFQGENSTILKKFRKISYATSSLRIAESLLSMQPRGFNPATSTLKGRGYI